MTQEILNTLRGWYESGIERHAMNVRIMVNNPIAIHDHTDFMGAVEAELEKIAEYQVPQSGDSSHLEGRPHVYGDHGRVWRVIQNWPHLV